MHMEYGMVMRGRSIHILDSRPKSLHVHQRNTNNALKKERKKYRQKEIKERKNERKKERKKRKNPRLTLTYQERYSAVAPQYNQQTKGRSVQQTSHVNRETCNVYNDYYPLIDSTKTDTLLPTGKRYTPWNFALRFLLSHCRSLGDLFRLSTTVLVSLISRSVSRSVFLQISIYC